MRSGPGSLQINPARHQVVDHEIARHLERETGRPFFMYRHLKHGTWVLCCWTQKSNGWCVELEAMGHPSEFTQDLCHYFKKMAKGNLPSGADLLKEAARRERESDRLWQEQNEEELKAKKYWGKRAAGIHADEPFWNQPGLFIS